MPSWFQSPLSRLLAAILAFLASPISASAWAISGGSTRSAAVKRIETRANPRNTILCPTYGADTQPIILEGRIEGDQTVCEYPYLDTFTVACRYNNADGSFVENFDPDCARQATVISGSGGGGGRGGRGGGRGGSTGGRGGGRGRGGIRRA